MDPRFSEETIQCIKLTLQYAPPPVSTFDIEKIREEMEILYEKINEKLIPNFHGKLEQRQIKIDSTTEIAITIYTPTNARTDKLGIYFHGGGWVMCSKKTHQTIVNSVADATNLIWILVDYRLAPEYKYPIWLNDAIHVTRFIIENKISFGVDPTAKIGIAGDSVGATISTSLANSLNGIDFQILMYGVFDLSLQTESAKEFSPPIYFAPQKFVDWIKATAFNQIEETEDPRIAPLRQTSLKNAPPCLLIAAGLDRFRDDSIQYKNLLERDGVQTKLVVIEGVVHGFFGLQGVFLNACQQALDTIQQFVASI